MATFLRMRVLALAAALPLLALALGRAVEADAELAPALPQATQAEGAA